MSCEKGFYRSEFRIFNLLEIFVGKFERLFNQGKFLEERVASLSFRFIDAEMKKDRAR